MSLVRSVIEYGAIGTHTFSRTLTVSREYSGKASDSLLETTDRERQAVLQRCSAITTSHLFKNEESIDRSERSVRKWYGRPGRRLLSGGSAAAAAFCHFVGAHTEFLQPRVDRSSENEASQVPAATTSAASESATAAAAPASYNCCEVSLGTKRAGSYWCRAVMHNSVKFVLCRPTYYSMRDVQMKNTITGCSKNMEWGDTRTLKQIPRCQSLLGLLRAALSSLTMSVSAI